MRSFPFQFSSLAWTASENLFDLVSLSESIDKPVDLTLI